MIKDYFLKYDAMNSDFTVRLHTHDVTYHTAHHEDDWEVTVAYTGERTLTGAASGEPLRGIWAMLSISLSPTATG